MSDIHVEFQRDRGRAFINALDPHLADTDIESIIAERQPQLVIHGHTHVSCDYAIKKTRVVCNPFGYSGRDENPRFSDRFVVDVTEGR